MPYLIIGLVVFLGVHAFTMAREQRAAAVARYGEGPYKIGYSLIAFLAIILIALGYGTYRASGYIPLWDPPVWTRHLAVLVMLPVFPLLFSAYAKGFVKARLKHPMILAVKAWALAHLLANGDLGSVILFGAFLGWAVVAFMSMRRRPQGNTVDFVPNPGQDAAAILGGLIVYAAMIFGLHRYFFGVGVFG
jgi:uncharacterized membrane protein